MTIFLPPLLLLMMRMKLMTTKIMMSCPDGSVGFVSVLCRLLKC